MLSSALVIFNTTFNRILLSFPDGMYESVSDHLSVSLNKLLASDGNSVKLNSTMMAINCCFDNFCLGIVAVSHRVKTVLEFINHSLKLYLMELRQVIFVLILHKLILSYNENNN